MKHFIFTFSIILITLSANAQRVAGQVADTTEDIRITKATILLLPSDTTAMPLQTVSNDQGYFLLEQVPSGDYLLSITSINYQPHQLSITVSDKDKDLGIIPLERRVDTLQNVIVEGVTPPVVLKGDTTVYTASQFKVNPDAFTEDLVRKMPGIKVDADGKVTAQGEEVKKVTVDGRDFFGNDATATLKNLPAEMVSKIQVFDKKSDQAQFTGFEDGNTERSINIVTYEEKRQGQFGQVYAGYGTNDRYLAGGNINLFNNDQRISILGLTNNVNQRSFSFDRGGPGGGNGINTINALGVNFNDLWGKNLEVNGSYFFNNNQMSNDRLLNKQLFIGEDSTQIYRENKNSENENFSHNTDLRLDYKIDSNNSILLESRMNFNSSNDRSLVEGINLWDFGDPISETRYNNHGNSDGYNLGYELLYRHAFAKKGRTISLEIDADFDKSDGLSYLNAENIYYKATAIYDTTMQMTDRESHSNRYSFDLEYTEPLGKHTQVEISYNPSFRNSVADYRTFNYDDGKSAYTMLDTTLSNQFKNNYMTQEAGIRFRYSKDKNWVSAGISYEYSELSSHQIFPDKTDFRYSYGNFVGSLYSRFNFSKQSNLRVFYRASVDEPSVNQLQNVINTTNPLFYSTGNPNLRQEYSHRLSARYRFSKPKNGQSFYASLRLNGSSNYISNATYTALSDSVIADGIVLHKGSQISKPVNLDGYFSARSYLSYGMPLKFIKSNFNVDGGLGYTRQPGLLNGVKNVSNALNYNIGASLSSNISEYVDFNLHYSINFSEVNNTLRQSMDNDYVSQRAGLRMNLLTKFGLFFSNDISFEANKGLAAGYNEDYWLWNMAVGQKFLKNKKGELKLSVFDLLGQNRSISRDVTESYIQDIKSEVLQQYFMLTFTYKLRNFGDNTDEEEMRHQFRRGFHRGRH